MTDVDGWLGDAEAAELRRLADGELVLELGAWLGRSTLALADTARLVVSVDHHTGDRNTGRRDTLAGYLRNVRARQNVVAVVGSFEDVVPLLRRKFGLVYVDGQHDYEAARRDILAASKATVKGGAVALHDYGVFDVAAAAASLGVLPQRIVGSLAVCDPVAA